MPRPRKKTVGDALNDIKDLQQRAWVQKAIIGILRSRYMTRDGVEQPQAHISCEGAPVSEDLIEEMVCELEEGAAEMEKAATAYMAEEISNGS